MSYQWNAFHVFADIIVLTATINNSCARWLQTVFVHTLAPFGTGERSYLT